jgi:uncharacterized protein (DUF1810 family)
MNAIVICALQELTMDDPYELQRFCAAQEECYADVLDELRQGRKETHWMWFIFPQISGLGSSPVAKEYALKNSDEALAYLQHPLLGERLRECAVLLLDVAGKSASDIFGSPDDLKLCSSMTLFSRIQPDESLFTDVLEKYYGGLADHYTIKLLQS